MTGYSNWFWPEKIAKKTGKKIEACFFLFVFFITKKTLEQNTKKKNRAEQLTSKSSADFGSDKL